MDYTKTLEELALQALPSERQLAWHEIGAYGFIHYGVNTYTGREWGDGTEDPSIFAPTDLDPESWVLAFKDAELKGLVLTAKHHDGFCMWRTKTTKHSVASSPYQGDVVGETAEACRKHGLKFGIYLSPWDQNSPSYGTDEYNDFYLAQLRELLSNYGEIFHVWFDGACGEGPNGKTQVYDFPAYIKLVRELQPQATIFFDRGPDVRWVGNEAGQTRFQEWGAVPSELCDLHEDAMIDGGDPAYELHGIYNTDPGLGLLEMSLASRRLVYCPSEVDVSIRPGWFYHEDQEPKSPDVLFHLWKHSVGGNSCLNLNVPPMPSGRFDPKDIAALKGLGERIRRAFALQVNDVQVEAVHTIGTIQGELSLGTSQRAWRYEFTEKTPIAYIVLQEDLTQGQRISSFEIEATGPFGKPQTIYHGTTVGFKKIVELNGYEAKDLKLIVRLSRGPAQLKTVKFYADRDEETRQWVTGRTIMD